MCLAETKVALLPAYRYPYPQLGGQGTQHASAHTHSWDELQLYTSPQAGQSASGGLLAVKDAHIAALQTELRGKDRILQAKTKVGAGLSYTALHMHTHMHNAMVQYVVCVPVIPPCTCRHHSCPVH